MKKIIRYFLPVLLWLILIFSLSLLTPSEVFNNIPLHLDKIAHVIEFGILGFLLIRAFYFGVKNLDIKRALLLTLGIAFFFAGADELHQLYIPGRMASKCDFFADIIGISCSQVFFLYYLKKHN